MRTNASISASWHQKSIPSRRRIQESQYVGISSDEDEVAVIVDTLSFRSRIVIDTHLVYISTAV